MPSTTNINLLKSKSVISPQILAICQKLKTISVYTALVTLVLGLVLGLIYYFTQQAYMSRESDKKRLIRLINENYKKESVYVALKQRLQIIDKAMANSNGWDKALVVTQNVIPLSTIISLSTTEGRVVVNLKPTSFTDAVDIVQKLLDETRHKSIVRPTLSSFMLGKDGQIQLGLSFIPVF